MLRHAGAALAAMAVALGLCAPAAAQEVVVRDDGTVLAAATLRHQSAFQDVIVAERPDGTLDPDYGTGGVARRLQGRLIALRADGSAQVVRAGEVVDPDDDCSTSDCYVPILVDELDARGQRAGSYHLTSVVARNGESAGPVAAAAGPGETPTVLSRTRDAYVVHIGGVDGDLLSVPGSQAVGLEAMGDGALVVGTGGLLRVGADGAPDPAWGDGGRVLISALEPVAAAVQDDGGVLVAGDGDEPGTTEVVRVTPGGALDESYGTAGVATLPDSGAADDVTALPGGGALVAGRLAPGATVTRLSASGAPDLAFGDAGVVLVEVADYELGPAEVVPAAGGAVLAGVAQPPTSQAHFPLYVARVSATGTATARLHGVDVLPPPVTVLQAPAAGDVEGPFVLQAASDEAGAHVECEVSGDVRPCVAPATFDPPPGLHTAVLRAVDDVGNRAEVRRLLGVAGDTELTERPPELTRARQATVAFRSRNGPASRPGDALSTECRLDDGAWRPCTSPVTTPELGDGDHQLAVRHRLVLQRTAWDLPPRIVVERDFAVVRWRVDTTAPTTRITARPAPVSSATDAEVAFAADDATAFECAVDGGEWAPCASPLRLSGLRVAEHRVRVRAIDAAGNVEAPGAEVAWTVAEPHVDPPRPPGPPDLRVLARRGLAVTGGRVLGGRVRLRVRSLVAASARVRVTALLGGRRTRRLALGTVRVRPERATTVVVAVPRAVRALARRRHVDLRVTVVLRDASGELARRTTKLRLRR